ncbi:titin isoform X2 [Neocloeon triangulifer]|uniref:titin isoform X2 n=1 Tax=Neocloeon triangulifer TaxID=2078957 RepID=UPI00286EDB17|nr:titin isoform X2 [Neocloeon triangulifer]
MYPTRDCASKDIIKRREELEADETGIQINNLPADILCNFRVMAENEAGVSDALTLKKFIRVHDNLALPSRPGRPDVIPPPTDEYLLQFHQPDVITVRWKPPDYDGGTPITGYLVERRDTAGTTWVRAHAALTRDPEVNLAGLEPGRRYQFRVMAENALGFSEPSEPTPPILVNIGSIATVPHFMKDLKDVIAAEQERVTFSVHVLGTPTPQIAWYKDAYEVFNSKRVKIVTDNERSSITFYQVALSDEGEIKCTATNRAGHIVTKATLRVDAPPRVKFPKTYDDGVLFEMGDVIRLKATISGRPTPIIYWLHNGEELQNDLKCEILTTEHATSLRILDSNRDNRGEYMVRASNDLGEDTASVLVTVTDRPQPPGKPDIASHRGRTVRLEWRAPSDDGGCKIGNFIVDYYRIGWNVWLKAATCRQLGATLDDLIEGSEYKFRIKAENPYGISDPSEESDTVFIPDPKRGLFKPPANDTASSDIGNIATDEWLEERRRRRAEMFGLSEPKKPDPPQPPPVKSVVEPPVKEQIINEEGEEGSDMEEEESEYSEEELEEEEIEEEEEEEEEEEIENENDELHMHRANSDELMVVLIPSKDKLNDAQSVTTETQSEQHKPSLKQQDSLDIPPPPMSLSAPELRALGMQTDEMTPIQFQRNAVSSTELLHEKAMARLYQALAAEEARNEKKRQETMIEEDAVEMNQVPENIFPRATITDTGQIEEIKPPPSPVQEKRPLKSVLKKPKRKIAENSRELGEAKKNKTADTEIPRTHTPVTFSDSYKDEDIRPVSPYLRGPFLYKDHDYDDVEDMVISRPTTPRSIRSARSVSPFSKVIIMEKPPEGVVLEPSPPPEPPPIPKHRFHRRKPVEEKVDVNSNEVEVFKVPQIDEAELQPKPVPEVAAVESPPPAEEETELLSSRALLRSNLRKPPRKTVVEKKEAEPSEMDVVVVEKMEIVVENIENPPIDLQIKPVEEKVKEDLEKLVAIPEEPRVSNADKRKGMIIFDSDENDENSPPTPPPRAVFEEKLPIKLPVLVVPTVLDMQETLPVQPSPTPSKKKRGLMSRLLSSKDKKIAEDAKIKEKEEKAKEKSAKSSKSKDKKSKKVEEAATENANEEKSKEKKGLSILGMKLRRPVEMVRDDGAPDAPARRQAYQQKTPSLRMSTESEKAAEEAEARAIVVSRYGELINDIDSGRRSVSRRLYLDIDEMKSQADEDEDPLEASIHSPSPVITKDEEDASAKIKLLPEDEILEGDDLEEDEVIDLPPSPPRSATPKHEWASLQQAAPAADEKPSSKAKSGSSSGQRAVTGEAAKETLNKATNVALGLFVIWISISVDWHLGLGIVAFYLLHKLYVRAKEKFLQLTGLKRRERTPEFGPGDDVPDPDPLPGLALLAPPPPPTPPSTPKLLLNMQIIPEENEEEEVEGEEVDDEDDEYIIDQDGNLVRVRERDGLRDDYDYEYDFDGEDEILEEEEEEEERLQSIPYRYNNKQPD